MTLSMTCSVPLTNGNIQVFLIDRGQAFPAKQKEALLRLCGVVLLPGWQWRGIPWTNDSDPVTGRKSWWAWAFPDRFIGQPSSQVFCYCVQQLDLMNSGKEVTSCKFSEPVPYCDKPWCLSSVYYSPSQEPSALKSLPSDSVSELFWKTPLEEQPEPVSGEAVFKIACRLPLWRKPLRDSVLNSPNVMTVMCWCHCGSRLVVT